MKSEAKARTFEDHEAKRSRVPLMIGLVGPSGGGKTMSALRLATGIQRLTGGDIFVVDTESRRSLHYANRFKFRHVPFGAPFSPLDYFAAIEHCAKKGAKIVIVDSMSHEHEGPGGVLEMHDAELQRMGGRESMSMLAWSRPKQERRRMINSILQLPVSSIFCFRAKEKLKIQKGKDPQPMGFMPIAGEEFIYEMTLNCLLLPKANGVPTWNSNEIGEKATMKLPEQFRQLFATSAPLSEDLGESLAKWAEGGAASRFDELLAELEALPLTALETIAPKVEEAKKQRLINAAEATALRAAYAAKKNPPRPRRDPDADGAGSDPPPSNPDPTGVTGVSAEDAERLARIERGEE